MKGDNDLWDRNTSNGRKRSYSHIPGYGSEEPKYIQLELNLGLEQVPSRSSETKMLMRTSERYPLTQSQNGELRQRLL